MSQDKHLFLRLLIALSLFAQINAKKLCPDDAGKILIYSPFKPYFRFTHFAEDHDVQKCWACADCTFLSASESRKQQWAATALIMGLIPLTLAAIAWPRAKQIYVTRRLNIFVEILVLALGLKPVQSEHSSPAATRRQNEENSALARLLCSMAKPKVVVLTGLAFLGVLMSLGGLAGMEIFSKRSALGCPFPLFVVSWHIVSLLPATIHAVFASNIRKRRSKRFDKQDVSTQNAHGPDELSKVGETVNQSKASSSDNIMSAIQDADEDWPVQFAWSVYYIAGTLVYTSIMAVQVVELVCWVALTAVATASTRYLAFLLCLCFEHTLSDTVYHAVE